MATFHLIEMVMYKVAAIVHLLYGDFLAIEK
jgi:hypothetical protein